MEWVVLSAMGAGGAMETIGNIKGGLEKKKDYYEYADTFKRRARVTEQLGIKKLQDIEREKRQAVGQVRARAGKAGVRIAGSVKGLTQRIAENYERQKLRTGMATMEESRGLWDQYGYYRKQGRRAKKAGYWGAGESLLSTAGSMGSFAYGSGMFKGGGGGSMLKAPGMYDTRAMANPYF